jgi:hypothetical protein
MFNAKVLYPNSFSKQTASASQQPPFFFGASNVPVNLGLKVEPSKTSLAKKVSVYKK